MILDILKKFPENRLQILICLFVIIIETFLNSISLTLIIPVIDQLVNNKVNLNFQIINLSFLEKYFNFFNIMMFFLFIFLFKFLISIFNSFWTSITIESIRLNLAYFYIYHHQNTKYEDVIKQKKGAVLNDVTKVANNTGIFIFSYLQLINCYLHILFILFFVIFIEYRVIFFFLFVLLIWFSLGKKYLNWSYNLGEKIIFHRLKDYKKLFWQSNGRGKAVMTATSPNNLHSYHIIASNSFLNCSDYLQLILGFFLVTHQK